MKIKFSFLFFIFLLSVQRVQAQDLRSFLKSCAYGTIGGASVGVVSLAFADKPSDSWNNVTRGASLGLYAGIAYGLYDYNKSTETYQHPDFAIIPNLNNGKIEGAKVMGTFWNY
ncbi:MAG: hypothetical protein ACXVCP_00030 [Bdellovibrio sp.]